MIQLSPPQKAAVEYIGKPTLVAAGAGSGKTRTLTAKFIHLVEKGYDPRRLLTITFTNKAAEEMKKRILSQSTIPSDRLPWVCTFHSACFKILTAHRRLLGYDVCPQIWDEKVQLKVVRDIVVKQNGWHEKYVNPFRAVISNAKNSGDPLLYLDSHKFIGPIRTFGIYKAYQDIFFAARAVDFDDIILLTRDILRDHQNVRNSYKEFFQYLLIDEYQDLNALQIQISDMLLKNGNLFVVGDDFQSIYGFRMSDPTYFLEFTRRYSGARVFKLEQNYRSADTIVNLGNEIIGHNSGQMEKTCFSDIDGGTIRYCEHYDDDDEGEFVAKQIAKLYNGGVAYKDIAVLYRLRYVSYNFERALRLRGIPYKLVGSTGFFDRAEVLDLNSYLCAAFYLLDDPSFERILNRPKRGIGKVTMERIAEFREDGVSLQQATRKAIDTKKALPSKISKAIANLLNMLDHIRGKSPKEAIEIVIDRTDYNSFLFNSISKGNKENFEDRQENLEQLTHIAGKYNELEAYLRDASLIKEDRDSEDLADRVRLSTVHSAKGLEYDVVFVAGVEDGLFPHHRSVKEGKIAEERRLFYVACTRAKSDLYLNRAIYRRGNSPLVKSQFIIENYDFLKEIGAVGKKEKTTVAI